MITTIETNKGQTFVTTGHLVSRFNDLESATAAVRLLHGQIHDAEAEVKQLQVALADCGESVTRGLKREWKGSIPMGVSQLADEVERLREAVNTWETDPHTYSTRPCGTCRQMTEALGKPFGCVRYALTGKSCVACATAEEQEESEVLREAADQASSSSKKLAEAQRVDLGVLQKPMRGG